MPQPSRPRLTRDTVLARALERADTIGLDALSMRALAAELGVVPMALYKHVANKDELIDGMVDLVWAEVDPPELGNPDTPWRDALRARAVSLREALRRHPWAVGLMESRMRPGLANLAAHNALLGRLREAGFPFRATVHVTSVLDAYVYGFALQERTLPFDTPEESGEVAAAKEQTLPPEVALRFPYLLEVVAELAQSGYDYDEEFATGLDLILQAVERIQP
ncbi:TetR/AcrR family transcriptional regulator [Leifsonia shinshuensis]|uniref:TetR/AcrR family transcriptional regulator n=1 Tax=Leifsonia shinshuensis TaxID=150026 RepID=UPI001627AB92|nr:TetR/AcrR family transcriptional regulator [Leifsonia shinshuensis]